MKRKRPPVNYRVVLEPGAFKLTGASVELSLSIDLSFAIDRELQRIDRMRQLDARSVSERWQLWSRKYATQKDRRRVIRKAIEAYALEGIPLPPFLVEAATKLLKIVPKPVGRPKASNELTLDQLAESARQLQDECRLSERAASERLSQSLGITADAARNRLRRHRARGTKIKT